MNTRQRGVNDKRGTSGEPQRARRRVPWRVLGVVVALGAFGWLCYFTIGWSVRASADAKIGRARQLLAAGQSGRARHTLRWLLWFEPQHGEALALAGESWLAERDFPAAAATFARVPADAPEHAATSLREALAYLEDRRLEQAERTLRRHMQLYPHSAPGGNELGWLLFNTFRNRELERFLEAKLEKLPSQPPLLVNLLTSEFRPPVPREELDYLEEVQERQPGQVTVLRALAYCYWQTGDLDRAGERFGAALNHRPQDRETRLLAASFLLELNQVAEAESLLAPAAGRADQGDRQSLARDDRWWSLRSKVAERRGLNDQALALLKRALALRPFELEYIQRQGTLLQSLGREAQAAQSRGKAKRLEECRSQLAALVASGAIERPTVDVCRRVADLCDERGKPVQANGWRLLTERLQEATSQERPLGVVPPATAPQPSVESAQ